MNMLLVKIIPYFRLKQLENHTLKCSTYPYSLHIGVPPHPGVPPCRAMLCCIALCRTVLCGVSPFYCILVLLCCTVLFPAVSYRAQLLYCAVLCRAVPCRAVPCRAVPCRAVLCSCHTRISKLYFYCHPILREPYLSGFLTLAFVFCLFVCLFVCS